MKTALATLLATLLLVHPTNADAHCHHHKACWRRVHLARATRWLWRQFHHHPMPYCTWGPESSSDPATGRSFFGRPWARGRYRVRNPHSTAGGKFQILDTTWVRNGGTNYPSAYPAAVAPPLEQEKIARRILAFGGPSQWVNC